MQQPSSDYSPDPVKETYISVELLNREADLPKENVALSGSSSPEDVFGSCASQAVSVCRDTTMAPGDCLQRRGYAESSLLNLPAEEYIGSYHAPFQFDRHALARISTSPTLRRLRMASASQALSFQDGSDAAQLGNQKEYTGSLHHICKSPPRCTTTSSLSLPSCVRAKLLSSKAKAETTIADPEPAGTRSKLPSQKDLLSNGSPNETRQHSWKANSATLPRRLAQPSPTPQEGAQVRGIGWCILHIRALSILHIQFWSLMAQRINKTQFSTWTATWSVSLWYNRPTSTLIRKGDFFPSKSVRDNGSSLVSWWPGWANPLLHMATLSHLCPFTLVGRYNSLWGYEKNKTKLPSSGLGFRRLFFSQGPSAGFFPKPGEFSVLLNSVTNPNKTKNEVIQDGWAKFMWKTSHALSLFPLT